MPNKEEVTELNQGVNYMDQNQHPVPPVEPVSVPVEPVQQPVVEPVQPNQQPIVNTVALKAQAGNVVDSAKNGFNTIVDKMKKDKGLLIGAIAGAVVIFILLVFVASKILNPSYNVVNKYMNIMKKQYQQPTTEALKMEPSSILCASMYIDPIPGSGEGF